MIEKKCNKCLLIKPSYEFSKNNSVKSGLHSYCKSCQNISYLIMKEKKLNGHNFVLEKKCNKCGEVKSRDCFTIATTSDGLYPYCKVCNRKMSSLKYHNDDEFRINVKKSQNKYYLSKYNSDDLFRVKRNISTAVCGYLKKLGNEKKWVSVEKILKYKISDLIDKIGGRPSLNHQLDHKIPCSWFLDDCPIDLMWSIENLWWVSKEYNLDKSNKWYDEVSDDYFEKVKPFLKEKYYMIYPPLV